MNLERTRASSLNIIIFLVAVVLISSSATAAQNRPFTLGQLTARPGESVSGFLEVPAGLDPATRIPVTVINGQKPGRVLAAVAGVHPYEYPPILALYRVKEMIKPEELSGTLILVHIANLPAFQRRTIYYNPFDWKNLNRVFPGDLHGTQSQRIAAVLTREVVDRAEALIDMHCGDGNEALIPYTYWMLSGDNQLDALTREMAVVFGLKHIIIDNTRAQDLENSKYLGNTAIVRKRPAITTESGYLGRVEEEAIAANVAGVLNVMKYFKMIPGQPQSQTDPVWIEKYEVIYSNHDGLFYPRAGMGDYVRAGQVVGVITDYHGNLLEEQRAPFTGILLYIIGTPPCNKGEPLFEVGRVKE
ncbi:MAG: M14 family metallopeptidase [Candidatus Saccharicenans sp.]|jgi:predicted deacylase|nr:M14 family metallopeptidase [Candidatus Saccharicenans sp.]MDH7493671.1 M14 family metallopeptidase [Candidatus Saccharicenans sp.]